MKLLKSSLDVTVVVSSKDRPRFLELMIRWFQFQRFTGELVIVDVSELPLCMDFLDIYDQELSFRLEYIHRPKSHKETVAQSQNRAYGEGLAAASRKFAVLTCDDDLVSTAFLERAAETLEHHHSLSSVAADRIMVPVSPTAIAKLKERFFMNHKFPWDLLEGTAEKRVESFLKGGMFHAMFCVSLRENWVQAIPSPGHFSYPHFEAEYRWFLDLVSTGPIKAIKIPGVFSLKHETNLSSEGNFAPWGPENPEWASDKDAFKNWLASKTVPTSSLHVKATRTVDTMTWQMIDSLMSSKRKSFGPKELAEWTRRTISTGYSKAVHEGVQFIRGNFS